MLISNNIIQYYKSFKGVESNLTNPFPIHNTQEQKDSFIKRANTNQQKEEQSYINNIAEILGIKTSGNITSSDMIKNIFNNLCLANVKVAEIKKFMKLDNNAQTPGLLNDLSEIQKHLGIDYKSGLYNAETLKRDIEIHKNECKKTGKPFSFAMFDFDNFKSINDLLSYDIGDEFIKTVGQDIGKVAEKHGLKAYRFGGEEFMILLPGYSQDEAAEIAQESLNIINNEYLTDKYLAQYISEGERIKNKCEERQQLYQEVMNYIEDDETSKTKKSKDEMKIKSIELLEKTKETLPTSAEKEEIEHYIRRVKNGESFSDILIQDSNLRYTLIALYNGQDKINTINKWIANVTLQNDNGEPRGFTMTSGVWQAQDMSKNPDDYIHNVGEVLSYGKRHIKGNVYCKTPNHYAKYKA